MMFAIAYDLDVEAVDKSHPRRARQAYADIAATLRSFGFERVQGSVFAANHEDLSQLFGSHRRAQGIAVVWGERKERPGFSNGAGIGFYGNCEAVRRTLIPRS
jgi:virulence-associated protein VapD